MKTKQEVEKHLKETGYSKNAVSRIMAFLVGAGVKDFDEKMLVTYGDGTWAEFYEWWEGECECDACVFFDLMNYLCEQHNKSENEEEKENINRFIEFLIEAFGDDDEEIDEE